MPKKPRLLRHSYAAASGPRAVRVRAQICPHPQLEIANLEPFLVSGSRACFAAAGREAQSPDPLDHGAACLDNIYPTMEIPPMNNKSITPNLQQPVDRVPTGQLPSALAELSESALVGTNVVASNDSWGWYCYCSFDGDNE